ncbi:MAG TPA: dienelactone hydrolase family protein [Candidatus Methylacidiphilales bacterium]|nr:dienelactone hydrolase family protein [Candidatus Methylacidiphilales bacterium]
MSHLFLRFSTLAALVLALLPSGLARGADDSKPAGQMIPLGDFGADEMAYISIPATPPSVGIVMVPDAFGLDNFTKAEANRLANMGYLVLAVDIYNGQQLTDPGYLANMVANLDAATVLKTINAGVRLLNESPTFHTGHVVVMGWGTGATYVFEEARDNKTLDGAIMFYGPAPQQQTEIQKFAAPVCALYPDSDPVATHDTVQTFQHRMKEAGNDFEAWYIAAGSGWSEPKSKNYNPVEDGEAWKVAQPFLTRIAAEPARAKNPSLIDQAKNKIQDLFQ